MCSVMGCPEVFSNASCERSWSDNHNTALFGVRVWSITMSVVLCIYYLFHSIMLYSSVTASGKMRHQNLRYRIAQCQTGGYICQVLFFVLGNNLKYPLQTARGLWCASALVISAILVFASSVMFLVVAQEIYLSSCSKHVRVLVEGSLNAVHVIVAPLLVCYATILALSVFGVIKSTITFTRVLYSASLPSIIMFGVQSFRYGTPVIAALERAAAVGSSSRDTLVVGQLGRDSVTKSLNHKANVFRRYMYFTVGASVLGCVVYSVVALTTVLNNPTAFIIIQVQTICPFILAGLFIAPLFGYPNITRCCNGSVRPTETNCPVEEHSSSGTLTDGL